MSKEYGAPFMRTFTEPSFACWASLYLAENDTVYTVARPSDWTAPYIAFAAKLQGKPLKPAIVTTYDVIAHPSTWALLGAINLAHAYRPEGLPR